MDEARSRMAEIAAALSGLRVPPGRPEIEIHRAIAAALSEAAVSFVHEARLGPRCRVDFLVDGIALEVKCGKPQRAPLLRQLRRYAQAEQVRGLILVVERNAPLPQTINGKPCMLFGLNRLWGIALH